VEFAAPLIRRRRNSRASSQTSKKGLQVITLPARECRKDEGALPKPIIDKAIADSRKPRKTGEGILRAYTK
jgi:hypothetical protein